MGHEFALFDRTSGIYVNPNSSGAALVLGIVVSAGMVAAWTARGFRYSCRNWNFVDAFSSCGAWLRDRDFWLVCIGCSDPAFAHGHFERCGQYALWLLASYLSWPMVSDAIGGAGGGIERLWFLNPEERADFSANGKRTYLAELGWQQFLEHPLVGNGIGSNGTVVVPLFDTQPVPAADERLWHCRRVCTSWLTRRYSVPYNSGAQKQVSLIVLVCVGLWGLVTHNIFTEYYWLVIALVQGVHFPRANPNPHEDPVL